MLFEKYDQNGLLFNKNFLNNTSRPGVIAYRGELVLVEGEVADASGRTKPPVSIVRSIIMIEDDNKIAMVAGFLDDVAQLRDFLSKYESDFSNDMKSVFYVMNISVPMIASVSDSSGSHEFVLIPLTDGVTWVELCEELALEKSDFKGLSSADKVAVLWDNVKEFAPQYDRFDLEQACALTVEVKREMRGPV